MHQVNLIIKPDTQYNDQVERGGAYIDTMFAFALGLI